MDVQIAKRVEIVKILLQEGRDEMLRVFRSDSCIAATRITLDVLAHFHVLAEALPARLMIFNPAFVQRIENGAEFPKSGDVVQEWAKEDGSWTLGVGYSDEGTLAPDKWPGHLVAVTEDRWLIDCSLDQAIRLDRDIRVGPAVWDGVTDAFMRGHEPFVRSINGSVLKYMAFPDELRYKNSPNWHNPRPNERAVTEKIIRKIEHGLG